MNGGRVEAVLSYRTAGHQQEHQTSCLLPVLALSVVALMTRLNSRLSFLLSQRED